MTRRRGGTLVRNEGESTSLALGLTIYKSNLSLRRKRHVQKREARRVFACRGRSRRGRDRSRLGAFSPSYELAEADGRAVDALERLPHVLTAIQREVPAEVRPSTRSCARRSRRTRPRFPPTIARAPRSSSRATRGKLPRRRLAAFQASRRRRGPPKVQIIGIASNTPCPRGAGD